MHKFLLEALSDWRVEPDPLLLYELAVSKTINDKDVQEAGASIPELRDLVNLDIGSTTKVLEEILPSFQKIYQEVENFYPTDTILFAGRDCRILYLYFKTFSRIKNKNAERFIQIPGSRDFYLEKPRDKALETSLLESFTITKKDLEEGKKYIFIDTGFEGSVGLSFQKFVQSTLGIDQDLSLKIKIVLVSSYANNSVVTQFADLGPAQGEMYKELREYVRYKRERGSTRYLYTEKFARINDYLAIVMQNYPQYHGPYSHTVDYRGDVIPVSQDRGPLIINPPFYVINAEFINPIAALRVDLWMIDRLIQLFS